MDSVQHTGDEEAGTRGSMSTSEEGSRCQGSAVNSWDDWQVVGEMVRGVEGTRNGQQGMERTS